MVHQPMTGGRSGVVAAYPKGGCTTYHTHVGIEKAILRTCVVLEHVYWVLPWCMPGAGRSRGRVSPIARVRIYIYIYIFTDVVHTNL